MTTDGRIEDRQDLAGVHQKCFRPRGSDADDFRPLLRDHREVETSTNLACSIRSDETARDLANDTDPHQDVTRIAEMRFMLARKRLRQCLEELRSSEPA